jgi:peptide chain release factor 1
MFDKLEAIEERFAELDHMLAEESASGDYARITELSRERADIEEIIGVYRAYKKAVADSQEAEALLDDPEMRELAQETLEEAKARRADLEAQLKRLLVPKDPYDEKDVIIEIRAGAGGDEAALFAAELYRMYLHYAERHRWKTELVSTSESDQNGFKEVIFEVKGRGAYSHFKYESGVHRVQRVPVTESGGRIHTSTATVAVMPEAEEVELEINPADLRIDVYRSSGHGGQSVNTTDSAVRITHLPTGLVVTCQDEKSQLKNRNKAMAVLRARLFDIELRRRESEASEERRSQVGTGDRSEKVRTYNFPLDRVTDHRIKMTVSNLPGVLNGNLDELIAGLQLADQSERLNQAMGESSNGFSRNGRADDDEDDGTNGGKRK